MKQYKIFVVLSFSENLRKQTINIAVIILLIYFFQYFSEKGRTKEIRSIAFRRPESSTYSEKILYLNYYIVSHIIRTY